jgi:hypothetical protein
MKRREQCIRLGNLRIAERFLKFELDILLRARFESDEMGAFSFVQVSPTIKPVGSEEKIVCNGEQRAVLVDVIKFVDSPERVIAAFVRFEPIDSFYSLGSHSLYFSSLVGFIFGESLRNRKFDLSKLLVGNVGTAGQSELVCEVIQSCPEIVNNIPSKCNDVKRESRNALKFRRLGRRGTL